MQSCRRKNKWELQNSPFVDYQKLLRYEKERSERHNHFFAFCGLTIVGLPDADLVGFLHHHLRASDCVFQVPNTGAPIQPGSKIGVLLPETDLPGAQVVKERMDHWCRDQKVLVQTGLVVYPDDATVPGEILEKAFRTVLPGAIY